eukprot:TRINITY_DN5512_c0_g1_i2.p1 TRINITY_DN5512_c0_g1~~TRINITY_DN5512_c0_g1_i2.p1  ORF type:complete len:176 (+),score=26.64 TRINITY_DN5512_c0_g1_i2:15-542(+)
MSEPPILSSPSTTTITTPAGTIEQISVCIKWNKIEYNYRFESSTTLFELKQRLLLETNVLPERQKLLGLKRIDGLPLTDITTFDHLSFVKKIMFMGTPEKDIAFGPIEGEIDDVVNDLDWVEGEVPVPDRPENLRKLQNRINSYNVKILNPPRNNKGCLVLDIVTFHYQNLNLFL